MAGTANSVITCQSPNSGPMGVLLSAAMTNTKAYDGTEATGSAKKELIFTAGANGARIDKVVATLSGTAGAAPSGTSNATVLRLWLNNNSSDTTATNNAFIKEITIPATAMSAVAALTAYEIPLGIVVPANYRLYAGISTATGGTNIALAVWAIGADL